MINFLSIVVHFVNRKESIVFPVTSISIDFRCKSILIGGLNRLISLDFRYRFLSINYFWRNICQQLRDPNAVILCVGGRVFNSNIFHAIYLTSAFILLTELFTCVSVLAFRSQIKLVTPRLVCFGFNANVFEEHPHTQYTSNARVISKPLPAGLYLTLKHWIFK